MKPSSDLLSVIKPVEQSQQTDFTWNHLSFDSRDLNAGSVFFAIPGATHDGCSYIAQAIDKQVAAIVLPNDRFEEFNQKYSDSIFIGVENIRESLAQAAALYADYPSKELVCIGITGTNGKTSTAWLITQLLRAQNISSVLCGTLGIGFVHPDTEPEFESTDNTTVDPISLQLALRKAIDKGIKYAVVEVTSQGIAQQRCSNIDWDIALFTNLTRDHLDIHSTFEQYANLKLELFSKLLSSSAKKERFSICNIDDEHGRQFHRAIKSAGYSTKALAVAVDSEVADYRVSSSSSTLSGVKLELRMPRSEDNIDTLKIESGLLGSYNLYNLLSAYAALDALGFSRKQLEASAGSLQTVPGRMQRVSIEETTSAHVFVDYAHTPDALSSVLKSVASVGPKKLTCVFGCGGDRDRGKRALMAKAVQEFADCAIVTSDNPRSEDPDQIVQDILQGFSPVENSKKFEWRAVVDRKEAIEQAIHQAIPGEVIIVAGKGHEDYQEVGGVKHPFLDSQVCKSALAAIRTS